MGRTGLAHQPKRQSEFLCANAFVRGKARSEALPSENVRLISECGAYKIAGTRGARTLAQLGFDAISLFPKPIIRNSLTGRSPPRIPL